MKARLAKGKYDSFLGTSRVMSSQKTIFISADCDSSLPSLLLMVIKYDR